MTPTDHLAMLIRFQKWRKGDDEIEQPHPRDISEALDYAIQCCEAIQSRAKTLLYDEITAPGIYLAKTPDGGIELIALFQCQIDAGEVYKGLAYQGPLLWVEE